ncbi:TPA: hypothetical protein ACXZWN_004528 [Salmonella enterica]
MWLNKRRYYVFFGGWMLVSQEVTGATAITKIIGVDALTKIYLTLTVPTCTLKMPDVVSLGNLKTGTSAHQPVKIEIQCPDASGIKTGLSAVNVTGELEGAGNDKMTMVSSSGKPTTGHPALLWLMDSNGSNIKLDGDKSNVFCQGVSISRICTLIPHTQVFSDTIREKVEATVRFNVTYP